MSAKYSYLVDTGVISVETASLLSDVQGEWKDVLGQSLDVSSSTSQGTLIEGEAVARASVMKNNADVANQINPDLSSGVSTDAIASFLGISRGVSSYTVGVGVPVTGDPDKEITAGSRVSTSDGDIFLVTANATINTDRTGTINIQAQEAGPIPLGIGPLTIVDGIIGWGSADVTSGTAVTVGALALTTSQLKIRRKQRLYAQGLSSTGAIYAHLYGVSGVFSVKVVENLSGQTAIPQNGIQFENDRGYWVCVCGPNGIEPPEEAVAAALHACRHGASLYNVGTNNGTPVEAIVNDPYSALPYVVKYTTPYLLSTFIKVDAQFGSNSAATAIAMARTLKDYADGDLEGFEGFQIGDPISGYELGAVLIDQFPGIKVNECKVALVAEGTTPVDADFVDVYDLSIFQAASLAVGNITVELTK